MQTSCHFRFFGFSNCIQEFMGPHYIRILGTLERRDERANPKDRKYTGRDRMFLSRNLTTRCVN